MLPLAWNENGDPVEPPEGAAAFRVRRATRGKPAVIYGDDGAPLRVPLNCDAAELSALVGGEAGRYRLDFVDDCGRLIASGEDDKPDHCVAVVTERTAARKDDTEGVYQVLAMQNRLLSEAFERSSDMQAQLVQQLGGIMDSAARILQAADSAGIPQRYVPGPNGEELRAALSRAEQVEASTLPEDTPAWAAAVEMLASQAVPLVKHVVNTKVLGLDDAQSLQLLGASPPVSLAGAATSAAKKPEAATAAGKPAASQAPLSNGASAHAVRNAIAQVLAQLTEPERQRAEQMLGALPEAVQTQVVAALSTMPLEEAVTAVRSKIQVKEGDSS